MTKYPKVSVVIITYGHEKYISQTLDGVLMQDYLGEMEVIIADDNSPDATEKIVLDFISKKTVPNNIILKYTKHKVNKGAINNFSWAIDQSTGKYIALCEGDDFYTNPQKLKLQVSFLEENPGYALCFTAKNNIDNKGYFINEAKYSQKIWSSEDVLDGGFIAGLQTIVSKNLSGEFNEFCKKFPDRTGTDRLYTYFYGMKGKIKYLDINTATYRIHEGGIWSKLTERQKVIAHVTQHLKFLEVVKKSDSEFKKNRRNMFRLMLKNYFFKFPKEPSKTLENISFITRKYNLSPVIFLLAAKDYLSYYSKIIQSKF